MSVLIVGFLMMFANGCSQSRVEYVIPTYAPLTNSITKPNPKPRITEQNFIKWKDSLTIMKEYEIWGTKESNRANACVIIYQKTINHQEIKKTE